MGRSTAASSHAANLAARAGVADQADVEDALDGAAEPTGWLPTMANNNAEPRSAAN
jgi:hypothetical protein